MPADESADGPAGGATGPRRRPRGSGARLRRILMLQEMEKAGMLRYLELVEGARKSSRRASVGFRVEVDGVERVLVGPEVEAYVSGMLDALRTTGALEGLRESGLAVFDPMDDAAGEAGER